MSSDQCTLIMDSEDDMESEGIDIVLTNGCKIAVSDISQVQSGASSACNFDMNSLQSTLIQTKRQRDLTTCSGLPDGKDAHFFVSYCNEDKSRVLPIIAKLEQDHGYACIIHERDFNPGMEIHENINRFMEKSMKILLFLSEKFLESGYCMHEKNLAFVMSMEAGENKIIPVLLEDCKVPSTLKTLTYIDMNADDVIDKIMSAYNTTDSDMLPAEFDQASARKKENGYTITLPCEARKRFVCLQHGQKIILGRDEMREIERGNVQVSDEITKEAVDIINSHVTSSRWISSDYAISFCLGCIAIPIVFFCVVFLLAITLLFIYDQHITQQTSDYNLTIVIILVAIYPELSILVCCIIGCCLPCRRTKNTERVKEDIFNKITLNTYKDGALFKVVPSKWKNHVTLQIIRYDIKPCQRYLARRIQQLEEDGSNEDLVESTNEDYDARALDLIRRNLRYLIYGDKPEAPESRHSVKGGTACFCQILEPSVEKP